MSTTINTQSLSAVKQNFYSLSRQIRSIESRIIRLEEEEDKQKKRLQNMKNKNSSLAYVKSIKHQRNLIKNNSQLEMLKQTQCYKSNNSLIKSQHHQMIKGILDNIKEQRKSNFMQITEERKKNMDIIAKTKESFLMTNRAKRDQVANSHKHSKQKIKQFWQSKELNRSQQIENQKQDCHKKITDLKDHYVILEEKQKHLINELGKTQALTLSEMKNYETLTGMTKTRYYRA